jgi:hypothetical protein
MKQIIHLPFTTYISYQNQFIIKSGIYFRILVMYFLAVALLSCNRLKEKKKWNYTPFSQGTIQFNIINDPGSIYYVNAEKYTKYRPIGWPNPQTIKVDKKGNYFLSLGLEKPGKVYAFFGEQTFSFFFISG